MASFTSYLANVPANRIIYELPVQATETIAYRSNAFETYESNFSWNTLSTAPIRQSVNYTYRHVSKEELPRLIVTASLLYDDRYPLFVPEFPLTQPCSLTNNILRIPYQIIKNRRQPWSISERTLVFNHAHIIAVDTPSAHSVFAPDFVSIALSSHIPLTLTNAYCCPLRAGVVNGDLRVQSLLYKGSVRAVFDFATPRNYSVIRDGQLFTADDLPPRVSRVEDAETVPDSQFVGERVRGKRVISPLIRRGENYIANFAPAMPDDFIIKQVYAVTLASGNNTITLPAELDGSAVEAAFSSNQLEVSYNGGLATEASYRYTRRT